LTGVTGDLLSDFFPLLARRGPPASLMSTASELLRLRLVPAR
jgi:hypothetical protein